MKPELPALVVFDIAGTTVEDGDGVAACFQNALREVGVMAELPHVNAVMGIPKPEAITQLLTHYARPDLLPQVPTIHARFVAAMIAFYKQDPKVREVPGASETFRKLSAAGVRVAVNTGFSRDITNTILDRLGWERDGLIHTSITSDEVPNGRPHPDMIRTLAVRCGISDFQQIAKVGDTPSDLGEGMSAGCGWVIGVTQGSHTAEQLTGHPHTHLTASVADLPALFGI
jgi:phosphonatase-like hydrolase